MLPMEGINRGKPAQYWHGLDAQCEHSPLWCLIPQCSVIKGTFHHCIAMLHERGLTSPGNPLWHPTTDLKKNLIIMPDRVYLCMTLARLGWDSEGSSRISILDLGATCKHLAYVYVCLSGFTSWHKVDIFINKSAAILLRTTWKWLTLIYMYWEDLASESK